MRNTTILVIMLLIVSVLIAGCSGSDEGPKVTGKATAVASPTDDPEPTIDRSYNTKQTTTTSTRTTTTTTATNTLSDEERAKQVAIDYIKNLAGYKYYNGRGIRFKSVTKNSGEGNYLVDATFTRDPTRTDYANEEVINVHLSMKKWKIDSYTFN